MEEKPVRNLNVKLDTDFLIAYMLVNLINMRKDHNIPLKA